MKSIEESKEEIALYIRQALTNYVGQPMSVSAMKRSLDEAFVRMENIKIIEKLISDQELVYVVEQSPLGIWNISWSLDKSRSNSIG